MSPFPEEVLANILSRLPVKCLLRSTAVSNPWLELISSSYFVKMHQNRSGKSDQTIIGVLMWDGDTYRVDIDSLDDDGVLQPTEEVDNNPLRFYENYQTIWGSCDGLLCVDYTSTDDIFICNPSTRKSIKLPYASVDLPDKYTSLYDSVYRFGYDNINDDYKVMRLAFRQKAFTGDNRDYEMKVYSLKSNSWHSVENFPHIPKEGSIGDSIAGGALHWISYVKSDLERKILIVAFDLGTEKYRVISPPDYVGPHFWLYLNNLGGCLSLSCHYESSVVDVFLLKEYGGENEHWSKLITISPTNHFAYFDIVKPITYSKCGKKVLMDINSSLIWYNLEQKSFEEIRYHGMENLIQVHTCLESLVSVDVPPAE